MSKLREFGNAAMLIHLIEKYTDLAWNIIEKYHSLEEQVRDTHDLTTLTAQIESLNDELNALIKNIKITLQRIQIKLSRNKYRDNRQEDVLTQLNELLS